MSEPIDDTNQYNNKVANQPNTEEIYQYTESLLKTQAESIHRLDTKLSAFLAFCGVLVKFAGDLPGAIKLGDAPYLLCNSCIVLKLLTFVFLATAALLLSLGLTSRLRGSVVKPEVLMEDRWYFVDKERYQCYIINTWIEAQKQYEILGLEKSKKLNNAVRLICAALITLSLSTAITTIYEIH